jgi:hypothetical protein
VVGAILGGRLMVLVDEYDRAPMANLMAMEGSLDVEGHDRAKGLVRMFLSALKDMSRNGADYFVTGITPMSMDGELLFNTATHLTFEPVFADLMGLANADVEAGLRQVAKITDDEELQRAMEVAKRLYKGTHFSGSKEALSTHRWLSNSWRATVSTAPAT